MVVVGVVDKDTHVQTIFFLLLFAVLLSLTFFPLNLGFLSFVALVPFYRAILAGAAPPGKGSWKELRQGFVRGWLGGVFFFGITFYWILLLPAENVTVPFVMFPAYLLMVAYLGLYCGLFGATLRLAYVKFSNRVILTAPFLWLAVEILRSRGALGFPWASLGYSLSEYPSLIQTASFASVYGVSFIIVVVNALIYDSIVRRLRYVVGVGLAFVIVVVLLITGQNALRATPSGRELTVGLVQGNMGTAIKWDPRFRRHNFDVLLELTEELAPKKPDVIIWPETAVPCYLRYERDYMALLNETVDSLGIPVLLGFPDEIHDGGEEKYYNSAGLVVPGMGLVKKYDKIHLVPFGERIPYDDVFPFLRNVNFGEADWERGEERTVFGLDRVTCSVLICFESIFPELVRSFKREGADFLVNITNDEWFGRSAAPYQHAYMAVFRAVENRCAVARCANTGISMLIDERGRVVLESPIFTREALLGKVRVGSGETFFTRHGFLLLWPLCGVALLEIVVGLLKAPR